MNSHWQSVARWICCPCGAIALVLMLADVSAGKANYKTTGSRSQYVHRIPLYDAHDSRIDPADPGALAYSPRNTCKKCHDYGRIAHGTHFGAAPDQSVGGRAGEPWIWTHRKTGSQLLLSRHGWPGTNRPEDVGLSPLQFMQEFGRHMCGGDTGAADPASTDDKTTGQSAGGGDAVRWKITGELAIGCMLCHTGDRRYSHEEWAKQIERQNFAWAASAALGLAKVVGVTKSLPDDFDPAAPGTKGVKIKYDESKFDAEGNVFFPIVRKPPNDACYACHTTRAVGVDAPPQWTCEEDVHVVAGLSCVDCHRNGMDHHTVRGFEGEVHATGVPVQTFSCRGCHLDDHQGGEDRPGGRLGAPRPQHAGLPALHLARLSCTTCHSGPAPRQTAQAIQTSMAHRLGIASQSRTNADPPGIVQPVFRRNARGVLYPYRMTWPAFWGWMLVDNQIVPSNPEQIHKRLRRTLRVRKDFRTELARVRLSREEKAEVVGAEAASAPEKEWTDAQRAQIEALTAHKGAEAFREKLASGLKELAKEVPVEGAVPVYVSSGNVYQLDDVGKSVATTAHAAADPYVWPLAHDVRPARQALGVDDCTQCHARGSALFHGRVAAVGPAPDATPRTTTMHQEMGEAPALLAVWELSFLGRTAFKWIGFAALAVTFVAGTRAAPRPRSAWLARVLYATTIACVAALALTSFGALQWFGTLGGWMLLAHVSVGGFFLIVLLPALALGQAAVCGVRTNGHGPVGTAGPAPAPVGCGAPSGRYGGVARALLGAFLACGLVTAGTMLLSMLPLFGTHQMEQLLFVHKYAGLALTVVALCHLGLAGGAELRRR